jgi:hypothetical protein
MKKKDPPDPKQNVIGKTGKNEKGLSFILLGGIFP